MNDPQHDNDPQISQKSDPALAEETAIVNQQPTAEVSFDDVLQQAAKEPKDPFDSEPACLELMEELKDLNKVRRLVKERGDRSETPTQLGQFELLECLGQGGMGQVFKARHAQLGKIQVVKVLHDFRLSDQQATARFRQEMRAIGALSHPNIVAAHHADEVDGVPYLVMDYVDGRSLLELISQQKKENRSLSVGAACELVRQAAVGLQYAHEQGIVHRDVKPGNMMLDSFGVVRILDLGLARVANAEGEKDSQELTSEYQILGTPDYMSPEQLRSSKDVDARTDVYALGATLYCLLTGRPPYAGNNRSENILDKALQVMNAPIPDIRDIRSDVPEELATVISHCLQKEPHERLATAEELAYQLRQWAEPETLSDLCESAVILSECSVTLDAQSPTRLQHESPSGMTSGKNRWKWIAAVAVLLTTLLAGVIYKLQLPDGGTLIVECDDPQANISIQAVQGERTKELEFTQSGPQSYKLSVGTWKLTIDGLEADLFELNQNEVTISKTGEQKLRVKRVTPILANQNKDADPAMNKESSQPNAPNVVKNNAEANIPTDAIDWTPGDPSRMQPGMVIQPAVLDEIFDWQIVPQLRMFGNTPQYPIVRRQHFDVDVSGRYFAMAFPGLVTVRDIETSVVRAILTGKHWRDVRFHPQGQLIAAAGVYSYPIVEIRDLAGRLKHQWSDKSLECRDLQVEWTPDGKELLLIADRSTMSRYTVDGQQTAIWQPGSDQEKFVIHSYAIHPQGKFVTWICSDGLLRNWDFETGEVSEFGVIQDSQIDHHCRLAWSPDGLRLAVGYYNSDAASPLLQLYDSQGNRLGEHKPEQWWALGQDIAWSPDSRFFVTADGQLFDKDLSHLRSIQAEWVFRPFWKQGNEIVGVNDLYEANSFIGWPDRVVRYAPTGRKIPTTNPIHPLSVQGSACVKKNISSIHQSPIGTPGQEEKSKFLFKWTTAGAGTPVAHEEAIDWQKPLIGNVSWSTSDEMFHVIGGYGHQYDVGLSGKIVHESTEQLIAKSPRGERLATIKSDADGAQLIEISDAAGKVQQTIAVKDGTAVSLDWSPDGRFLAWNQSDSDSDNRYVNVVDVSAESHNVFQVPVRRSPTSKAFSPDSRWLIFEDCQPKTGADRTVIMLDLKNGNTFRHEQDFNMSPFQYPTWSADSQTFFAGSLFRVDDETHFIPIDGFRCSGSQFTAFGPQNKLFVWGQQTWGDWHRGFDVISADGTMQKTIPINPLFQFHNANLPVASSRQRLDDKLLGRSISGQIQGIGVIDTQTNQFQWSGYAFHDGTTLTLDPGGRVLHGPQDSDLDRYVIHTIRYPGGRTVPLTRTRFLERILASMEQKAILWAHDQGADLGEDMVALIDKAASVEELPTITAISQFTLQNAQEISDKELTYLQQLTHLQTLELSDCSVTELPDLRQLQQLESADFSRTQISSIEEKLPEQLKKLSLARTAVTEKIGFQLAKSPNLESLDLSGTNIDNFTLLDLRSMVNLKELILIDVDLSTADIAALQGKLSECQIRTGSAANPVKEQ